MLRFHSERLYHFIMICLGAQNCVLPIIPGMKACDKEDSPEPSRQGSAFDTLRFDNGPHLHLMMVHLGSHFVSRLLCSHPEIRTKFALYSSILYQF